MESTLVKYVWGIIAWLRRIYTRHPDFVSLKVGDTNAVPEWWTRLSPQFKKQCHRREENLSSDYTYGSATVRPLYYHGEKNDPSIQDIVSKIDLESILKSLMMKAQPGLSKDGPLQHRSCLSTLYNAAARPGEVKHVDTSNWMWHGLPLEALDIKWLEVKTLSIQAMSMLADKLHYLLCWYHSLGSYWCVEMGLHRNPFQDTFKTFLYS